jgi:hypothetical protein
MAATTDKPRKTPGKPRVNGSTTTPTRLADLLADPSNRRAHNPRNLGMVVDALRAVGAARSIVIDETNTVLAGNGVTEAATAAGLTKLQVVDVDGETVVAVRRSGLTPEQKRALAIYDNRTAELAEWDIQQLAADLQNGEDLTAFFLDGELAALRVLGDAIADPQGEWQGMPEYSQPDVTAFHTLHVHFKDAAALEAFGALIGRPLTKTVRFLWVPDEPEATTRTKTYA